MTLPSSGAISLAQIADEFDLAHSATFPTAFYGKGGAPSSSALSFSDFYGRSAAIKVTAATPVSGRSSTSTVSTNAIQAMVQGGSGSYTGAWTKISGDSISIGNASSMSTSFYATGMSDNEVRTAVFQCTVTDTVTGLTGDSNLVYVDLLKVGTA